MRYTIISMRNNRYIILLTALFICLFVVLAVFPVTVIAVLIALSIWALMGQAQAIEAISLSVIIKYLNTAIYSFPPEAIILFFAVMFIAAARIIITISGKHVKLVLPLLFFFLIVVGLSVASSPSIEVSIMKALLFTIFVSAILIACYKQKSSVVERWQVWFLCLSIAIILLSVATLFEPQIAYFTNGSGFQGLFNHPQVLGPWVAILAAWTLFSILLNEKVSLSNRVYLILTFGLLITIVIASKARTGMVSFLLSFITTYMLMILSIRKLKIPIGRSTAIVLIGIILLSIAWAYSGGLRDIVGDYIQKDGKQDTAEAFRHSRGSAAIQQWDNFIDHPLTGNGFGVYPSGYFPSGIKSFYGIPISASVEKGFLPTAIFEEIGLIGVLAFLYFFTKIVMLIINGGDPKWIAVFFACLYLNTGEAVLFSAGGIGLYYWCLMGLSLAVSTKSTVKCAS